MTTVVCNRSEMAADGRVTSGYETFPATKIFRINDALYGAAGIYSASVRFMEWARRGETGRLPKLAKEFVALKLTTDGIYVISSDDPTWMLCNSTFFAIGSGRDLAIGAMSHGATPLEAVITAMKWDTLSGGEPTVLSLTEKA
jgi:ATP-dependent protease HslVU (ClpYQ) peptidase subunit